VSGCDRRTGKKYMERNWKNNMKLEGGNMELARAVQCTEKDSVA
jgi:hypothetical protein